MFLWLFGTDPMATSLADLAARFPAATRESQPVAVNELDEYYGDADDDDTPLLRIQTVQLVRRRNFR